MRPGEAISAALRARAGSEPALVAFLMAGHPNPNRFVELISAVSTVAAAIEIGVPHCDPVADGPVIRRASRQALAAGVTLERVLQQLAELALPPQPPLVLMSYRVPLLAFGSAHLASALRSAGVAGLLVPDQLPEEEQRMRSALEAEELALVQLVTPLLPPAELARRADVARGFVYAATSGGVTGSERQVDTDLHAYLDQIRALTDLPVCAGFGIRNAAQVAALAGHADGVVVGSALIEAIAGGQDPAAFLRGLRAPA
ncbi:MAG: tryptophan synthase subunit alpha [Gammaproteobacteria bacterium]|nr:tryptophan synthase subunit alpha [Gammaproteobacteria bacterium]